METKTTKAAIVAAVALVAAAAYAQPPTDTIPAEEAAGGGVYFGEPATLETLEALKASGQLNLEAKTVLAQALWGEAGIRTEYSRTVRRRGRGRVVACDDERAGPDCYPNTDWRLIPWVMLKRWEDVRAGGSRIRFASLVRAYSSPLRPGLASDDRLRRARLRGDDREVRQINRRRFLRSLRFDGSNLVDVRRRYGFRAPLDLHRTGWEEITDVVDSWAEGQVPNPCPDARHWDSFAGAIQPGMIRVCPEVETLNAFYAFPRRRPVDPSDS